MTGAFRKRRRSDQDFHLQITSLIDTLVIILVFMLMTIGSGTVNLEVAKDVRLPWSMAGAELTTGLKLVARNDAILLENEPIVPLENGAVARNATSEDNRKIVALFQKMAAKAGESKRQAASSGVKFDGTVLFQADKSIPLKTIKQVLYTAARAGYNDFKFAVIRQ